MPGIRRNRNRPQFDFCGDTADGYGFRCGGIGRERYHILSTHEKSVRFRRLGVQIDHIARIGEPTVFDAVRKGDGGRNVRHYHDSLLPGEQSGDRRGETRCGERLPLVQRTVGVKHEYRRILDRIFGLFQLIRIFRRNDGFGAGRLTVQRNGQ